MLFVVCCKYASMLVCLLLSWPGQFHQHFSSSFYAHRSQKRKKYSQVVSLFLCFWDLLMKSTPFWPRVSLVIHEGSISSTFYMRIFCKKVCSKPNTKQIKAAQKTFCTKNVDEIDTSMSHLLISGRRMGYFVICLKKRLLTLPLMWRKS